MTSLAAEILPFLCGQAPSFFLCSQMRDESGESISLEPAAEIGRDDDDLSAVIVFQ
jgi:hypothetical protein